MTTHLSLFPRIFTKKVFVRRWVYFGLALFALFGLTGCKKVMDQVNALLGDKEGKVGKVAKRPTVDPVLIELRKDALELVQQSKARPGWTVLKEVENYQKIASAFAKKKKLPKPTGFDWTAICARGGTCRVLMGFWDGRTRHQAAWFVSGKEVKPLNCWAFSFMAKGKEARACFAKQAKKKATNKAPLLPRAKKPTKARGVFEKMPTPPKPSMP